MCFKLSKKQLIILLIVSLIGAVFRYLSTRTLYGIGPDPNATLKLPYTIFGFFIFGILTYLIEVIYNYFKKQRL